MSRSGEGRGGVANTAAPTRAREATVRGGGGTLTREEEHHSASKWVEEGAVCGIREGWRALRAV